jgi:hypothetical protein
LICRSSLFPLMTSIVSRLFADPARHCTDRMPWAVLSTS